MAKMTRKLIHFLHFVFRLAVASQVTLDFNKIATFDALGMVCRVKGREKESLIKIYHGGLEKVTLSVGCIINSNDTRLNIRCIETEDDIMLSVNLTYYDSSDLGTWNCSDGKSYATVTFPYFAKYARVQKSGPSGATLICIVHEECNISLSLANVGIFSPYTFLITIDGNRRLVLRRSRLIDILDNEWRRRMVINDNATFPYLNFTLLDVALTDAGIYYLTADRDIRETVAFIIKIADYPEQPVISLHEAESKVGMYELFCASESKSQPILARKQLSYIWRLNGHNLTEVQLCFRLSGPVLMLCPDACEQRMNGNISITCAAAEDGLESNESQPLIIPISRVIAAASPKGLDHQLDSMAGTLVGACLGSFITGIIIAVLSVLFVTKRGAFCIKEHRERERTNEVPTDSMYVNSIMSDTHEAATEGVVRQYESLDHSTIEISPNQYDAIYLKGSGQNNKEDAYEVV